jgi:hypothetical protein
VLHWNGTAWTRLSVPSPGGTAQGDFSELLAVRCRTAKDCWSVGDYANDAGATLRQALHWNGTKWSVVPTPNPGGTSRDDNNFLLDVVCPAASDCWAAGQYGNAGVSLNQLLRWNGSSWTPAKPLPQPAGTSDGALQELLSVRCTSAKNCLAVGDAGTSAGPAVFQDEALRWNGTKWSVLPVPSPNGTATGDFSELSSLACTSATYCWAAGAYGSFASPVTSLNQMLFWDGTVWTQFSNEISNPGGTGQGAFSELNGITCGTPDDCWTVGDFHTGGAILNQALHWDGEVWRPVTPVDPGGTSAGSFSKLSMVRCITATNCWAVGEAMTPRANQALHWNGTQWSAG